MSVLIEPMLPADAQRCAELEKLLFDGDEPWGPEAFLEALANRHHYLVAREARSLIGYAGLFSGPPLIGLVAQLTGLGAALTIPAVLLLLVAVLGGLVARATAPARS